MSRQSIILNKHLDASLKTVGITVPTQTKEFILRAMQEYADVYSIDCMNANSIPKGKFLWLLPGELIIIWWTNFILRLRYKNLKSTVNNYQKISNLDGRKYYIIRSSETKYIVRNVKEVDLLKRKRIFKNVNAKDMS
jgi:hypothetical protein